MGKLYLLGRRESFIYSGRLGSYPKDISKDIFYFMYFFEMMDYLNREDY